MSKNFLNHSQIKFTFHKKFNLVMLRRWFMEHKGEASSHHYDSDEKFIKWLMDQKYNKNSIVNRNLNDVRKHSIVSEVTNLLEVFFGSSEMK